MKIYGNVLDPFDFSFFRVYTVSHFMLNCNVPELSSEKETFIFRDPFQDRKNCSVFNKSCNIPDFFHSLS